MDQEHICWKLHGHIAFAFRSPKVIHLLLVPGEHGEIGADYGGVGKSGVLEHKSGNISETRKDRGKLMEGL